MSTEPIDIDSILDPKLWYLYGKPYDFSSFISRHPGGEQAILLGRGRDCTALFQSYHTRLPGLELLKKYSQNKSEIDNATFTYHNDGFYRVVKDRAADYFSSSSYSHTKGGFIEIFWWLFNLFVFLFTGYYSFIRVVPGSSLLGIINGISKSLLVIRSTHSASHFSFSQSQTLNRIVYWFNMSLLGDTPVQWTAKHCIAHHIDTNVIPIDDDTMYPIKRVLMSYDRYWYHKYQHIYIWLLYFFVYYPWTVSHNIKFIIGALSSDGNIKEGAIDVRLNNSIDWIESISCMLVHHVLRLLPFIFLPTWYHAVIITLIAEFSGSMWFSLQFAVNHETAESVALSGLSKDIFHEKRDWGQHQLVTSHNYSVGFWPTLHLSGGLNYQIEHHLFPSVHYKHYPALSKIVRNACKEFKLPYNQSASFLIGITKHFELLKMMGNNDKIKLL